MRSAVAHAHDLLRSCIVPGDTVIDATAGNGHDTLFLARLTGPGGKVFAFDIQPAAIAATRSRLESAGIPPGSYQLIQAGHESMSAAIPGPLRGRIAAVVFNLGYLPGSDQSCTTAAATTLPAIRAALQLLRPGGMLIAVLYTGHPGGSEEAGAVRAFAASLPSTHWQTTECTKPGTIRPAPAVFAIRSFPVPGPAGA